MPAAPAATITKAPAAPSTTNGMRMALSITVSNIRPAQPCGFAVASSADFPGSRKAARTGASVSAVMDDSVTAKASTKPNSLNTPPA